MVQKEKVLALVEARRRKNQRIGVVGRGAEQQGDRNLILV